MKKLFLAVVLCSVLFLFAFPVAAHTPYGSKTVTLPTFSVTVNEQEYNYNEYETYPVFVHDCVTYFPLTYNNAMILNLIPAWNAETGSHEYQRGCSDLPKQFFKTEVSNTTETQIDEKTVRIDTVTYQVHHPKETKNPAAFSYHYQIEEKTNKTLIDGKNLVTLSDYPILFYNDMVYIPLTWQFVTEVLGGTVTFDMQNGLEVRVNNYFTTLNGDSYIESDESSVSYKTVPNDTYYIKDNLTVFMFTDTQRLTGPIYNNLTIKNGDKVIKPEAYFGYFQKNGPLFTIENNKIKSNYYTGYNGGYAINPVPCLVDIETGEITEI